MFTNFLYAGGFNKPVDPDAQAFITAAGITNATEQDAINTLVGDLKTAGLWTKFLAIYPFVGGTSTSCKYNLVNPLDTDAAFRLTFNSTFTFNSSGIRGTSNSSYANTHIAMSDSVLPKYNFSVGLYQLDSSVNGYINSGISAQPSGGNPYGKWIYYNNLGGGSNLAFADAGNEFYRATWTVASNPQGLQGWTSSAINSKQVYLNTTLKSNYTTSTTNSTDCDNPWTIGRTDGYGLYNGNAFAYFATAFTSTEYTTLYGIIQTFQTSLGRQV